MPFVVETMSPSNTLVRSSPRYPPYMAKPDDLNCLCQLLIAGTCYTGRHADDITIPIGHYLIGAGSQVEEGDDSQMYFENKSHLLERIQLDASHCFPAIYAGGTEFNRLGT